MEWQLIITGFLLGAVSSFHCVGMCGPIALSLPVQYLQQNQKVPGILLYNAGRISLYALLGLLFGYMGRLVYLGGFQQVFSIILGSIILLVLFQSFFKWKIFPESWLQKPTKWVQQVMGSFLKKPKLSSLFLIGTANGLLPCGMVYFAITGAMAAGTVTGGVAFMAAFGLGTFPAMFTLSFFGSVLSLHSRNLMKKAIPFVVFTMGVLLILRGLNLNIPYISPLISNSAANQIDCH
jgi:hypothetical protein